MNRAAPKLRDFAERLIALAVKDAKFSASEPSAVFAVIEQLRPCLVQVVGDMGYRAVLLRALAISNPDAAWLHAVRVNPDGSLAGLDELNAEFDAKEIAAIRVFLLAEFVGLLVNLIGERLVLQLVYQAMPKLSKHSLYFGKGPEHET